MSATFTIVPRGPFSLAAAAAFGFGQRDATPGEDAMRLAFAVDGFREHAGVVLSQDPEGAVHGEVSGAQDVAAVERQVARVLSLDADGEAWLEVGRRDPVIGRLQAAHPGQRPVLFHSPYEAAAWAVISARINHRQAGAIRRRLGEELGATFDLAGEQLTAFPLPERLLELDAMKGLPAEKVARLHGIARAALEGKLEPQRLRALDPEAAEAEMRELRGIGPFYAALIVVRATGQTDALPRDENRVLEHAARLYGRPAPLTAGELRELAEPWRPFRTWAVVLIRLAGDRASA